jgi:hypothetical protein
MLNIIITTIKCPTELSHFRDRRDTTGGNATVKERAPTWANDFVLETDNVEARSLAAPSVSSALYRVPQGLSGIHVRGGTQRV